MTEERIDINWEVQFKEKLPFTVFLLKTRVFIFSTISALILYFVLPPAFAVGIPLILSYVIYVMRSRSTFDEIEDIPLYRLLVNIYYEIKFMRETNV